MPDVTAYVALGGNLGDPLAAFHRALELMPERGLRVVAVASAYRTTAMLAPDDPGPAPDYWNSACAVQTALAPRATLDALRTIETHLGRVDVPKQRWRPRTLDLDLLLHGATVTAESGLTLPHPELSQRIFVLRPLCDIAAALVTPDGVSVDALLAAHTDPTAGILETRRDW